MNLSGFNSQPVRDFSHFPESPAMTLLAGKELCASPIVMFAPPGRRCITPLGASGPRIIATDSSWAVRLSSQLKAMLAAGRRPFLDLNHGGVLAGYVQDFWWKAASGILALIDWLPAAEQAILRGECTNLSPQWVISGDGELVGIGLNAGALVSASEEPAYGKHLCRVFAISKAKSMQQLAGLFLAKVELRGRALEAGGVDHPLVRAAEEVGGEFPRLRAAFELRERLQTELRHDFDLMVSCT